LVSVIIELKEVVVDIMSMLFNQKEIMEIHDFNLIKKETE